MVTEWIDRPLWNVIKHHGILTHEPNEMRILRLVRDKGAISRIEIAKATGLHKATVTALVIKLIHSGFLEDTGEVEARNKVGRKRILLRFRPLAGFVAGVDIRMTSATVALFDLNARLLAKDEFDYAVEDSAQEVLTRTGVTISNLLKAGDLPRSKLAGIGVGVQGVVDCSTNTLIVSQNKKSWQGESLGAQLESQFAVPVYVENDVKTMAIGEYLFGTAKQLKDFVHIWVGEGVGAGIMINGQLLHGITNSAGEIGYHQLDHPLIHKEHFPLMFRDQEMFGEILTDANLIESYRKNAPGQDQQPVSVAMVAERARSGDIIAQQVVEEFASLLSILCITMVNTLNPEMIVVGGKFAQEYPAIAELLQLKIHKDLLALPVEVVRVRPASHGEFGVTLGAAGLVLYEFFEPFPKGSVRAARRLHVTRSREYAMA